MPSPSRGDLHTIKDAYRRQQLPPSCSTTPCAFFVSCSHPTPGSCFSQPNSPLPAYRAPPIFAFTARCLAPILSPFHSYSPVLFSTLYWDSTCLTRLLAAVLSTRYSDSGYGLGALVPEFWYFSKCLPVLPDIKQGCKLIMTEQTSRDTQSRRLSTCCGTVGHDSESESLPQRKSHPWTGYVDHPRRLMLRPHSSSLEH